MNRKDFQQFAPNGMVNRGNRRSIQLCMEKAETGQPVTLGFLGGSITQGSLASSPETCYAHLVYQWWKRKFPKSAVSYINAGVGGTTSQFGVARVKEDLLAAKPDFIILEFSVNDGPTDFFEETYEGLVRTVLKSANHPAVLLLHNVRYDNGISAEERHLKIGRAYDLPCVSMKASLYPCVVSGLIRADEISPDGLHPNDFGHSLIADTVAACLEDIYLQPAAAQPPCSLLPKPVTKNRFEDSFRLRNYSYTPHCLGFRCDDRKQNSIQDCFKQGWMACKVGDAISFEFEGTGVAVQYRKSVLHPAPVAQAVLDGNPSSAVILDGNFDETWGDCLFITTLAQDLPAGKHCLEIRITKAEPEPAAEFYLAAVLVSR